MEHNSLGQIAEQVAANYLVAQKYELLGLHYYNPRGYHIGEIDLVAKDPKNGMIVFVEVKARKGNKNRVIPEANITPDKIHKIEKAAQNYLNKNKLAGSHWRIDAVLVVFDYAKKRTSIRHVKYIRNS